MTSQELYLDIKYNESRKAYLNLKKRYIRFIQKKYTIRNCYFEAEDRFSNAFSKLLIKIASDKLPNTNNISGYFLCICKNDFIQDIQRNKVIYVETMNDVEDSITPTLEKDEITFAAHELIDQLPKQLKAICQKLFIEGKDHKEVAKELKIDYQNIRKYQYKAIKILRLIATKEYQYLTYAA